MLKRTISEAALWLTIAIMASAAALLASTALPPTSFAAQPTEAEQQTAGAHTQDAALALRPATETLRGVVDGIDESSDTIKVRLSADKLEKFRVQDGLIFNAVRYGDRVELTVRIIAGAKTVVDLVRE
jgi:Cu/Ag efflux protein CusF